MARTAASADVFLNGNIQWIVVVSTLAWLGHRGYPLCLTTVASQCPCVHISCSGSHSGQRPTVWLVEKEEGAGCRLTNERGWD